MQSSTRVLRFVPALAAAVALGLVVGSASAAAAVTTVDGNLPLDLVDGSRLFGIEQYHDKVYEFTAGPLNTTVASDSTFFVQYNLAATFDPDSGKVYFLTGSQSGCALNYFDPDTSSHSLVVTLTAGGPPLTGCWGLTTLGGGTALLAAGSTLYNLDLTSGALSSPRSTPCPGSSLAFDPSTGDLYSGKNTGELYRMTVTDAEASCDLVTTLVDVVDGGGENLKGFTFDTDGTLYLLARWAPKLFSLTPADITAPINYYGDLRYSSSDPELPIDSLVMVYTPLPDPPGDDLSASSGATVQLPTTGVPTGALATGGALLVALGVTLFVVRRARGTA